MTWEPYIAWVIPATAFIFCGVLIIGCIWYINLRERWHEKGILDFRYDGHDPLQNPEGRTLLYYYKQEKLYDSERA